MKRVIVTFLLLSVIVFTNNEGMAAETSGMASGALEQPAYGDAIVAALSGNPSVLIPMLAGDSASHDVAGLIFNGLVKYDTDLSVTGDLAESWEISPDGLVITFHLKKGIKWTDGVEFTADDVMFGYKTIIDEKTATPYKGDYLQVKKAEVLDRYTFRVAYDKPFAPALTTWGSLVVLPKHLLEGKDITKSKFARNPVGMGPYKLKKWAAGQEVVLDSNRDYFEGRPFIDRYIYRIIPDPATQFIELRAGGLDRMGLTPIQYKKQTDNEFFRKNFRKFRYPVPSYTYMGFNLRHPWFKDKRVRQAIAYAIDKEEIVDVVLFGLGRPATGPYVPGTWYYNPDVRQYEYDINKAQRLLKEAGWSDTDNNGILDKDGKPFEFTILTNMGNNLRKNTATIIQWRLRKIGINVRIRLLEWSAFINEFIDKRRFEMVILGWSLGFEPDQYDIWHSSKTGEKEFNFVSYSNPDVDELLEKGRRTFDIEKRKKAYYRIQEILADELPYIFLYVPDATPVVHSRFKGIKPTTIGIGYNLHEWYVPKNLQRYSIKP
ncbi:oligopeptide-binding protein AppA precursor [bacterium BMS3Abin06]|nr:oligopeptide-binding protein AppA precursor [bacterium BMS3Abin06]